MGLIFIVNKMVSIEMRRYFTWDSHKFPNPVEMQNALAARGRKMVTIIDPHIKVDSNYHIYRLVKCATFYNFDV